MAFWGHRLHNDETPMVNAPHWALEIYAGMLVLNTKLETIMATLDQVLADVTAQSTRLDSLAAFIGGLQSQLADALSGTTIAPAVQAKIDQIFATTESNTTKLDAALNTNVPPPVVTPPSS